MSVTVNICSFFYGHLAAHCIESVLAQTRPAESIRLYDDGVGDCEHLRKLYPDVEIIKRHRNLGIVENFNLALKRTKTEQVMFLGADNWLHPETLRALRHQENADIMTYDAYLVGHWDNTKRAIYDQDGYVCWKTNGTPHGSALYNVALAKEVGGYEASGNNHTEEDSMLFNKMIKAGATVRYVERPLLYYRHHKRNYNAR